MRLVRVTSLFRSPSAFAQIQRRVLFSQTPPPSLLSPRRSDTLPPSVLPPSRSNSLVRSPSKLYQIQCRGLFSRTPTPYLLSPVRSDSPVPSPSPLSQIPFRLSFSQALPSPLLSPRPTTMDIPYRYFSARIKARAEQKGRWENCYLQLYSIRLLQSDREDVDQVCGSIELGCGNVLFNRQMGQGRFEIDAEGFLRLNGPEDPVWGDDYTRIYTKLYRENKPNDFFHPVGGVKSKSEIRTPLSDHLPSHAVGGIFGTDLSLPEGYGDRPCNTLITEKIETIFGITEVACAIFTDGADSYLTIKVLNWTGDGIGPNIYGSIVASDTLCGDDFRAKSSVFDTKRDEEVLSVPVGHRIPLRRPMNVVPMYNSLKVDICLYHKNDTGSRCDDPLILKSTLNFEARCGAEGENTYESKEISGKWCALQVTAHWLPYWSFG